MEPNQNTSANSTKPNPDQPVAYDSQGRPLYAHPPAIQDSFVNQNNSLLDQEAQEKHKKSVSMYPNLNLSSSEYVINAVRRHFIGLATPIMTSGFLVILTVLILFYYPTFIQSSSFGAKSMPDSTIVYLVGLVLIVMFMAGGFVSVWVYRRNKFFLTNESVIQELQTSLFSQHEQTVSLSNVEDASYQQTGVLQSMLDYGSIRLSTQGDETTYRFTYVKNPKKQIATLNNAIEAFKMSHPYEEKITRH